MDRLVLEWLEGLAQYDCVFIKLIAHDKRPPKPWDFYEEAHERNGGSCLHDAYEWVSKSWGLGFLLRGDLWVLDIDSPEEVERCLCSLAKAGIFPPFVRTQSNGAHLYFRFPKGFPKDRLKNHLNHPMDPDGRKLPIDFKLGPRTLVVAPGSHGKKGPYIPMTPWTEPPELDPRRILPSGEFWFPPRQPFLQYRRPFTARVSRACRYLASSSVPVSVSGKGGRKTLLGVAAHLVAFLRLDPAFAQHLLTHGNNPWNSRCKYPDGRPYPWSHLELWRACSEAVDAIPRAGVMYYARAMAREARDKSLCMFCELAKQTQASSNARMVRTETLCRRFNEWAHQSVTVKGFSRAIHQLGITTKLFSRRRVSGVNVDSEAFSVLLSTATPVLHETPCFSTQDGKSDGNLTSFARDPASLKEIS